MFTGIIEEVGTIRQIRKGNVSGSLTIGAKTIMEDMKPGDSIAVNGICLTVCGHSRESFTVDVMHETFERSAVSAFRVGTHVNLERAMAAGGRFGGHIVSGHIDGTGRIVGIWKDENAVWYEIAAPASLMRYIVEKGSVAVDGVSLTVAAVLRDGFRVSVIPHTRAATTMEERKAGDPVNLENDCIAKYVEKLLGGAAKSGGEQGGSRRIKADGTAGKRREGRAGGMTEAFLAENGFL